MQYDAELAERLRGLLARHEGITEKRMFGGICFLLRGNMCLGVVKGDLVVRTGPVGYAAALAEPHARPMDFTGRALKGFVFVGPEGYRSDAALEQWVARAHGFAASLPSKA